MFILILLSTFKFLKTHWSSNIFLSRIFKVSFCHFWNEKLNVVGHFSVLFISKSFQLWKFLYFLRFYWEYIQVCEKKDALLVWLLVRSCVHHIFCRDQNWVNLPFIYENLILTDLFRQKHLTAPPNQISGYATGSCSFRRKNCYVWNITIN